MTRKIFAFLAVCLIFTVVGYAVPDVAFAATTSSDSDVEGPHVVGEIVTSAYEDFKIDESFDINSTDLWPSSLADLNVFQVAESVNKRFYIYVSWFASLEPAITSVNLSLTNKSNPEFHLYNLKKIDTAEGDSVVVGKYLVEGLFVSNDDIRFYNIASIYRTWDKKVDVELLDDPSNEVACRVGKLFAAKTVNGIVEYMMDKTEVVVVTDKYLGNLLALDKVGLGNGHVTMTHFVAFNTDYAIDQLIEARVSYLEAPFTWDGKSFNDTSVDESEYVYSDSIPREKTVKHTGDISYARGWFLSKKYTWKEIQTVDSFISSTDLNDSAVASIRNMQWVLVFAQSDLDLSIGKVPHVEGNNVREVTILELTFVTAGYTYKLGAVDNKDTSASIDNASGWDSFVKRWNAFWQSVGDFFDRVGAWCAEYWWVLAAVGGLIAIGILVAIFKPFRTGVMWVLKILWYIISSPARLIVLIVNKAKERHNEKQ